MRYLFLLFLPLLFFCASCGNSSQRENNTASDSAVAIPYPLTKNTDSLLLLLAKTGVDTNRVNILAGLSWQLGRNYPDSALQYGREALTVAQQTGFRVGQARAYHNVGWVYNETGQYDSAFTYLSKSLEIFREQKNSKGEIAALNALGTVYWQRGDYDKALSYFLPALQRCEQVNNMLGRMTILSNIGMIYDSQGNHEKALENFRQAKQLAEESGNTVAIASYYINIGKVYGDMGVYDSSLVYNQKALAIKESIDDKNGEATCYNNIAQSYLQLGQIDKAVAYNTKSLALQSVIGDRKGVAITMISIAEANAAQGNYAAALKELDQAMDTARRIGTPDVAMKVLENRAEVYSKMGDFRKAYDAHLQFASLKDSLLNETSDRNMAEMQTKFETEKKDREIRLLNANAALQDAEIKKTKAEADQRATQRNAFLAGFVLVLALVVLAVFMLRQKQQANKAITLQKSIIEQKNKDITDSINYAKRIQGALLASDRLLQKFLPEYFILHKPKDIVSGDFYWASPKGDQFLLLAGDCTGHGVPGAFMSLLNISILNETVNVRGVTSPDQVLNLQRDAIIAAINPEGAAEHARDGMDCVLCLFDFAQRKLFFAGANNPLWLIRGSQLHEYAGDKQPVGVHEGEMKPFTLQQIDLQPGDEIILLSDGYADQFGGPNKKKFKYRPLKEKLLALSDRPMETQRQQLEKIFEEWRGNLEQVDDVLLMGIKIR